MVEAAASLGVTRQQLYRVLNGTSAVRPEIAFRLEKAIGTSADTRLKMQAAFDLARVRQRAAQITVKKLVKKVASQSAMKCVYLQCVARRLLSDPQRMANPHP